MARKPNYQFERLDRERVKAQKVAEKAALKREAKEREERERTGGVNPEELGMTELSLPQRATSFTHETVNLDGMTFEDCEFRKCRLIYSGGEAPDLRGLQVRRLRLAHGRPGGRYPARTSRRCGALAPSRWCRA